MGRCHKGEYYDPVVHQCHPCQEICAPGLTVPESQLCPLLCPGFTTVPEVVVTPGIGTSLKLQDQHPFAPQTSNDQGASDHQMMVVVSVTTVTIFVVLILVAVVMVTVICQVKRRRWPYRILVDEEEGVYAVQNGPRKEKVARRLPGASKLVQECGGNFDTLENILKAHKDNVLQDRVSMSENPRDSGFTTVSIQTEAVEADENIQATTYDPKKKKVPTATLR